MVARRAAKNGKNQRLTAHAAPWTLSVQRFEDGRDLIAPFHLLLDIPTFLRQPSENLGHVKEVLALRRRTRDLAYLFGFNGGRRSRDQLKLRTSWIALLSDLLGLVSRQLFKSSLDKPFMSNLVKIQIAYGCC